MSKILNYASQVFKTELKAVSELAEKLDHNFEQAIQLILDTKGKVVLTGMGKSGRIGQKISSTLSSTGTPSVYLHPSEAAHGDLGIVSSEDILITIGKSGESDELVSILPIIQKMGVKIISLVGNLNSSVAKLSDVSIDISVSEEACDLKLAPTSSTTASLVMGDAIAVVLMKLKNFKSEHFAFFHPAGQLGKRLLLETKDIMRKGEELPFVFETSSAEDLIYSISHFGLGVVAVCNEKKELQGIITDGDLRRALESYKSHFFDCKLSEIMTKNPFTVSPKYSAYEALLKMEKSNTISHLPVIDKNQFVGMLCLHDLIKAGL